MKRYLKELGEDRFIKGLAATFSAHGRRLIKAIGDDTSVTLQKGGMALLATTDILIEGTHFKRGCSPPYLLGRKALGVSLSDIAAMGGEPRFFLVSIALPAGITKKFVDSLYRGLADSAEEFGCALAGGNTARLPGRVMVSTTVFGEMYPDEVVYRSGAREGDAVYVTGTVGDSALGLKALKRGGIKAMTKGPYKNAVLKHLNPTPRISAGRLLASKKIANAMIDVSDGVALDLKRLCSESRVGAVIEAGKLPLSDEMKRYAKGHKKNDALRLALSGGEDYELLFTAPEGYSARLASIGKRLGLLITPIGRIVGKGGGVKIIDSAGNPVAIKKLGFEHF